MLQNSRTPENLMKALNSGHVAWVVPNWQATANGATVDAAEFFDLSHEVWSACSAHIKDNTITSTMYAIVWDALQSAYTDAMAANYFSCARSLRFIFEFAVQAALLEIRYAIVADSQSTKIMTAFTDSQFQRFKFPMLSELENSHNIARTRWGVSLGTTIVVAAATGGLFYWDLTHPPAPVSVALGPGNLFLVAHF